MTKPFRTVALFILLVATAKATVMLPMYLDDLTNSSQTVVYGTITAKRAEWAPDHRMIYTVYTVEPLQYLKGSLGASFEMREPGGELEGEGYYVASVPQYEVGQEAVLFLWTDPAGQHQVTSFEQGSVQVILEPSGAKTAARRIPLGSANAEQSSSALVGSAAEVIKNVPATALSERSLSGLLDQIRLSVAHATAAVR